MLVVADLEFELGDASLQVKQMLLQVGLLGLQGRDLLLQLGVLTLLPVVALLHLILSPMRNKY